jgi:peptidoglycan/LPS O-acetylase OafA/YrhL
MSFFKTISWNLDWESWPMWIPAWPVAFGLLQGLCAAVALIKGEFLTERWRWIASSGLIAAVAVLQLLLFALHCTVADLRQTRILFPVASSVFFLCLLIVSVVKMRRTNRLAPSVTLIGSTWVLVGLYPVSEWTPLHTVLWAYGFGYWMLLAGVLLLAAGSIRQLTSARKALDSPS